MYSNPTGKPAKNSRSFLGMSAAEIIGALILVWLVYAVWDTRGDFASQQLELGKLSNLPADVQSMNLSLMHFYLKRGELDIAASLINSHNSGAIISQLDGILPSGVSYSKHLLPDGSFEVEFSQKRRARILLIAVSGMKPLEVAPANTKPKTNVKTR